MCKKYTLKTTDRHQKEVLILVAIQNIGHFVKVSFDVCFKLIAKFQWMPIWFLLEFFFLRSNLDTLGHSLGVLWT